MLIVTAQICISTSPQTVKYKQTSPTGDISLTGAALTYLLPLNIFRMYTHSLNWWIFQNQKITSTNIYSSFAKFQAQAGVQEYKGAQNKSESLYSWGLLLVSIKLFNNEGRICHRNLNTHLNQKNFPVYKITDNKIRVQRLQK